jgi:ATP-binding cassette, subfamily F, member 3
VTNYDGDLDEYRRLVLSARNGEPAPRERNAASEKPQRPRSDNRGSLKKRIAEAETEIARVSAIISKIDTALALPDIFTRDPKQAAQLSKARANAADALARAEEQWLEASTQFDEAAG